MGNHLIWSRPLPDATWDTVKIESSSLEAGPYTEISTQAITDSTYFDPQGTTSTWYRIRFYDTTNDVNSAYSTVMRGTSDIDSFTHTIDTITILGTLGASGPDTDDNFTLYGMKINQSVAESIVSQCYEYTTELIGAAAIVATDASTVRKVRGFVSNYAALRILGILNGVAITKHFNYSSGGLNIQKPVVGQMAAMMEYYKGEVNRWRKLLLTRAIVDTGTYAAPSDLELAIPNAKEEDSTVKVVGYDSASV